MSAPDEKVLDYATPGTTTGATKVWHVGTLSYGLRGLIIVFTWMLFGDFCFTMMESVIPTLLPLTLKDLGSPNWMIGLLMMGIPLAMNSVMTPILGFRSDRLRTRWGRRIPYLVWPTPFITLSLIAVGYSTDVGAFVHRVMFGDGSPVSPLTVTLWTVGILSVVFQFFNLFVSSVYYWLFNDVIPEPLMGRFYGMFRMVGNLAGFIYNRWVFGMADTHRKEIYVVMGLIYFVAFMLMCWRVKEGQYPPPDVPKGAGFITGFKTFVRQCYSLSYYWWFYLAYTLVVVANGTPQTFRVFFATKQIGLSYEEIGRINSWGLLVGTVLAYPLGWLADKIHSVRLYFIAVVLLLAVSVASFWGIQSADSFWWMTILWYVAITFFGAANAPLFPQILPKDQYGQFAGGTSLFTALVASVMSYVGGMLIDVTGDNYRIIYLWSAAFNAAAIVFTILLYRGFIRYGGDRNYVAPVVAPDLDAPLDAPVVVQGDRMSKEEERRGH